MTDHAQISRDPVARIAPLVVLLCSAWGCAIVLLDNRTVASKNSSRTNAN